MAFECSYAGVGLCVPTPEAMAWANENISPADLRDVQPPSRRPGKNLRGLAWDDPTEPQPARIGEFHWPSGATRWAVGRFLVTGATAFEILTKVIPGGPGGGYKGADLILQSDGGLPPDLGDTPPSITARMYALPPRPLAGLVLDPAQTDATKDLYLLTLVDVRYFWQWATVTAKGGAWDELVSACAAGLDIDLDAGSIDPVYGRAAPDSGLWVNEENAALVLDAVLWNTGRVLAANYDGTFTIQKVIDCREAVKRERKFWKDARTAGGPVLNLDAAVGDEWRKALLPQTVRVTFPKVVEDEDYVRPADDFRAWHTDSYGSVHSVQIDLTTLDGYKQHVGTTLTWSKTFHDTAFALYPFAESTADPDNQHDLWCLAVRVAKDYADGLLSRLDEVYPGVLPWTPDGVNDIVVTYRSDDARTRVRGRSFNAGVTEFQHCLPFDGGESGSGSGSGSGCSGPVGDDCPRTRRSGGDQPLARVVGDGPVDRLCGPGWGSGDLSCPNFLDPPAGPIYDADLVTPPRRVPHPTLVDVLVYTDFEAVKPIWLLQPNGGRWPFGVLPRDNIYLTRRLVAEAVCVCGETRPMYVTDDAGASSVSGFWAILTDSPCGGSGSGSGSGGCNRTGYGWILATTDGAGNWTPFAGVPTLGATYGTTTDYPALEVNGRLPTLSADPPTVVWLRPTPGANPDCPTFSFEWQSAPAACPGACVRTREVTFSYTKDDGMGGCCTETTTITLPVDVDVCVTSCGGSGGSGG